MLVSVRAGLPLFALASLLSIAPALGQDAPKAKPAAKAAGNDPVLATVNGDPIRQSEITGVLSRFSIPPGQQQDAYDRAVDLLVNTRLLSQFLAKQKIKPDEAEINRFIAMSEKEMKENSTTLEKELAANGLTMADLKARLAHQTQWKQYLLSRATEAELKKYVEKNKDLLNGTLVHARHILVKVDEDASEADKEKAKQKLLDIKKEIDSGKISFIDAANKYSEDDGNVKTPTGGDLGYFPRRDKYIEPFSAAAFAMKKGETSDPVLTEYGWHLIQIVDRKEGTPVDVKQMRDAILNAYGEDLQAQIVEDLRPKAQIDIKPMPPGVVPVDPAAAPASTKPDANAPADTRVPSPATKPAATTKPATPK